MHSGIPGVSDALFDAMVARGAIQRLSQLKAEEADLQAFLQTPDEEVEEEVIAAHAAAAPISRPQRPRRSNKRGHHMKTAAAREAASKRMRLLWAKRKQKPQASQTTAQPASTPAKARKRRNKQSAEGRARIVAAQLKRWAKELKPGSTRVNLVRDSRKRGH
jgi:hypothetical protein